MVEITLEDIGKKYNNDWIFANLSCTIAPNCHTAILGANGSGKSTLLQVIMSSIIPTTGSITYTFHGSRVLFQNVFRLMSVCAPYIELIEEFTLEEMINFHRRLKPLIRNISAKEVALICNLENNYTKHIKNFSSGMKQRVRLALSILSETPILLLDEPTSNLDQEGIIWYNEMITQHQKNRIIIVSSNSVDHEFSFCSQKIILENYKKIPEWSSHLI
jgi:ABC-type multidrug transport system ATPase subunit